MPSRRTLLVWETSTTPPPLQSLLNTLELHYPIAQGRARGAIRMEFAPGAVAGGVEVTLKKRRAVIAYDKPCHAARGISALLAGLVADGQCWRQSSPFETFGIMLDCSRNAVMTVEHFQAWLRQLALLGYNMAMLYTEDTYELPNEPYFGYLRGRYSADELRRIDDYAASLGIEMVGCIQTLGHLEQVLKWAAFKGVKDTHHVLLADEDATYALIDKMLARFAECFRSRRIHIGMDEAHDLGRGMFLDRFGYQRGYDIFNRHLSRVLDLCGSRGLSPMIWSDMYFRMGSKAMDYYDKDCRVPDDVRSAIPRQVQLVYWDYYHDNEEFYLDFIARHRELGFEPTMASGVWTWSMLWHGRELTHRNAAPCIAACRKAGVKEFFFTLWGDDGGYCEFDSALAGLAWGAEMAYGGDTTLSMQGRDGLETHGRDAHATSAGGQIDLAALERRYAAVCGGDYRLVEDASGLNDFGGAKILWDDPMLGIFWKAAKAEDAEHWTKAASHFASLSEALSGCTRRTEPVDLAHACALAQCLREKIQIGLELQAAYFARDKAPLAAVAAKIPGMIRCIDRLAASFRRQWMRRNKSFGLEVIQIRLGGLKQRYVELTERLAELQAGRIDAIGELDEDTGHAVAPWTWRGLASGSSIV